MANVAIGIIFGATRIFSYSLTSAYVFPDPLRRIWRKRVSLLETSGLRRRGAETGLF
jgi:hypothetical protein